MRLAVELAVVGMALALVSWGSSVSETRKLEQHRLELKAATEEAWNAGYLTGIEEAEPMQEGEAYAEGYVMGLLEMHRVYEKHAPGALKAAGVRFDPQGLERRFSVFGEGEAE